MLLDETGSGKTLAYLLPILTSQLHEREELQRAQSYAPGSQAMLLAPNRDLVMQIYDVVQHILTNGDAGNLIKASALTEPDADGDSDVLVATPAIALRSWRGSYKGGLRGPQRVRWLVLDEADTLLAGSFKEAARAKYPIEQLIHGLKLGELGKTSELKRDYAAAASAVRKAVQRGEGDAKVQKLVAKAKEAKAYQWKSVGKQFVLVGATFPNAGVKNIENHINSLFPTIQWIRTSRAHRRVESLRQFFVKVEEQRRGEALRAALSQGPAGPCLVFANTIKMAEEAKAHLDGYCKNEIFHKGVPAESRDAYLDLFDRGELPVLVCTGLASRGIDFSDVAHVIQYDMADNAVEYMHRVGRTARGGKSGVATTLYAQKSEDLVSALQEAIENGQTIEALFSRKRLFRRRINKALRREHGAKGSDGSERQVSEG